MTAAVGPVNAGATLDLDDFSHWLDRGGPVPALIDVTPFDLGEIDGAGLGFTDAAETADGRTSSPRL